MTMSFLTSPVSVLATAGRQGAALHRDPDPVAAVLLQLVQRHVGALDDAVDRNLFVKKVAAQLQVDEEVLKAEIRRGLSHAPAAPALKAVW